MNVLPFVASSPPSVIDVAGLSVDIATPLGPLHALRDVTFSIRRGETLALVGESGCGKTMTSLAVMGLLPAAAQRSAIRLSLEGRDLLTADRKTLEHLRGARMSMVFQDPMTSLNPVYTVGNQLEEIYLYHNRGSRRQARERAEFMLNRVGISAPQERMRQYPHQLSGGLRQRVVIAMALMCEPALIIADEPTTALDVTIQAQILHLLKDLQREFDTALMLITHDMGIVARVADQVAVMYAGRIVEQGRTANVFATPRHPYTQALLRCIPNPQQDGSLGSIPGRVPSLIGDTPGCLFRNRCGFAMADCATQDISLHSVGEGHGVRCLLAPAERKAAAATVVPIATPPRRETSAVALACRDLGRTFHLRQGLFGKTRDLHAVQDVTLDLRRGEVLAIVGESGSGKTTLARMLLGLLPATSGAVMLDGKPITDYSAHDIARRIQPIFQDPYSSLNPRKTVHQIVSAPLQVHALEHGDERRRRVDEMLDKVGLSRRQGQSYPNQLSGGQRQRVAIARALVMKPTIVVCDEPTSALDVSVQAQILNLLSDLRRELGVTYLFISHDLAVVRHMADRVAVMYLGRIVESGRAADIFDDPRHPYARALLASALTPDPQLKLPDVQLAQGFPGMFAPGAGCQFRPRCPQASGLCASAAPPAIREGERMVECHLVAPARTAVGS